jgi:D-alanyl-D-alanine carboxypeptidase
VRALIVVAIALLAGALGAAPAAARSPALVLDYDSGEVVLAQDADQPWFPASLTKLMTVYLAFEALTRAEIAPDDRITVSEHAAAQTGTRLGLTKGATLTVLDAIHAAVLRSANDAAVALAEHIAANETAFAERMTKKAHALGMTSTVFRNATGLPDAQQWTTASDMARLASALIRDFADRYALFALPEMTWQGKRLHNINGLLTNFPGADGLKTGFTCGAGYNIVASAHQDGRRLIAVLLGATSLDARRGEITRLLQVGFSGKIPKEYTTPAPPPAAPRNGRASLVRAANAAEVEPGAPAIKIKSVFPTCDAETQRAGALAAVAAMPLRGWALTVGNAHQERDAKALLEAVRKALGGDLRGGRPMIVQRHVGSLPPYRALVVGFDETRAIATCLKLRRLDVHCIVLNPEQLAAPHALWN